MLLGSQDHVRGQVLRQLATTERAGIPFATAAQRIASGRGATAQLARPLLAGLEAGDDVGAAFARAPGFSPLEQRTIAAAAKAGILPEAFARLADLCEERVALRRKLVASLAYPFFLLHAAVFLPAVPTLIQGGLAAYAWETLVPLGALYGASAAGLALFRALRGANPVAADGLILATPGLGGVVRKRALAVSLRSLSLLLRSGISVLEALPAVAETCPNAALGRVFARVGQHAADGADVGEAFALEASAFPAEVVDYAATGSRTGQLDTLLDQAATELELSARAGQTALLALGGVVAFLIVAALVAYKVIGFYAELYGQFKGI